MGAFISIGDVGIWATNYERNAFLDWFAEFRCSPGDDRWQWCKSEAQRWTGRCIELTEFLQADEAFQVSDAEVSLVKARYGTDVAQLIKHIEEIRQGKWEHRVDSREAVDWRDTSKDPECSNEKK
jgi:hypothetical protein